MDLSRLPGSHSSFYLLLLGVESEAVVDFGEVVDEERVACSWKEGRLVLLLVFAENAHCIRLVFLSQNITLICDF